MPKKLKIGELTPSESLKMTKDILKRKRSIPWKTLKPGHLIFTSYRAKYAENTYDQTPLVLVLRKNGTHTLGLAFHWVPFSMRVNLVKEIIKRNEYNIRERKPLKFQYEDYRGMMKKYGYAPCIRLYINKRFGRKGVVIPSHQLMQVARLRSETFTKGRYSSGQMYGMARRAGLNRNKTKK